MSIDRDDPRLTAFALGELEDANFAAELQDDPVALAEVDAIRAMAARVTEELGSERADGLTEAQRATITPPPRKRRITWAIPAAAAVVTIGLVFAMQRPTVIVDQKAAMEAERLERHLGVLQNRTSQALADKANAEGFVEDVGEVGHDQQRVPQIVRQSSAERLHLPIRRVQCVHDGKKEVEDVPFVHADVVRPTAEGELHGLIGSRRTLTGVLK